jgi:hypothetical protein
MPDHFSGHLCALSRRDFLKIMVGEVMIAAYVVFRNGIPGAPAPLSPTGYGSGKYGAGKYGITAKRYSIFLSDIRK